MNTNYKGIIWATTMLLMAFAASAMATARPELPEGVLILQRRSMLNLLFTLMRSEFKYTDGMELRGSSLLRMRPYLPRTAIPEKLQNTLPGRPGKATAEAK